MKPLNDGSLLLHADAIAGKAGKWEIGREKDKEGGGEIWTDRSDRHPD